MAPSPTRRGLLRSTGGAAAALVTGSLAGCSSVSVLVGDDGRSPARNWLYDPTGFTAEPVLSLQFEAPRRMHDERDRLHPEVRERFASPAYADGLDAAATDWALSVTEDLFRAPFQYTYGGSFGRAAARRAAAAPFSENVASAAAGEIEGLQRLSLGDDAHGAYRDGLAVGVANATGAAFERLVAGAADRSDRLDDAGDDVAPFLDALGFDHTVQATFSLDSEREAWTATGMGYRIDGDETRLRFAVLNDDRTDAALREFGVAVDGVRDVSVDGDGPVRWVEGVADTDSVGFRGRAFGLFELPYE